MEVLEPLWFTITTVHDLLKAQSELSSELLELANTVKLISIAVKPLLNTFQASKKLDKKKSSETDLDNNNNSNNNKSNEGQDGDDTFKQEGDSKNDHSAVTSKTEGGELGEVLDAIRDVLSEAETTLKQVQQSKQQTPSNKLLSLLTNPFKSQSHVETLKSLQDKLKTLTPILSLAVNTYQHESNKKVHEELLHQKHQSNSHNHNEHNNSHPSHTFSIAKLLTNEDARSFWTHHFGDQEYKVSWSRFIAAFEHQHQQQLKELLATDNFKSISHIQYRKWLKRAADKNGDDDVDVYEYDSFVKNRDVFVAFEDTLKQNIEQQNKENSEVSRKKRKQNEVTNNNNTNNNTNSNESEDTTGGTMKKSKDSMGPPLSPRRPRSPINTEPTSPGSSSSSSSSRENTDGYKLKLIGKDHILTSDAVKDLQNITQTWNPDEPFTFGRVTFAKLPAELLVRLSRTHAQINCVLNPQTNKKEFWIVDKSGNGTYLNGRLLGNGTKAALHDGDRIGLLMFRPGLLEVELGYLFTTTSTE